MAGESAVATVDAGALESLRRRLGLSRRALARHLGVAPPTVRRWERGDYPVSEPAAGRLQELATSLEPDRPGQRIVQEVAAAPGTLSVAQVKARGIKEAAALDELLDAGELVAAVVVETDAKGRRYPRRRLFPAALALRDPAGETLEGAWIRERRQELGWTMAKLGLEAGVSGSTVRGWETGHQPVPVGRAEELRQLLSPKVTGAELRRVRKSAGWSLDEMARRVGIGDRRRVAQWEGGARPVPARWTTGVRTAIRDAQVAAAAGEARRRAVDAVVDAIGGRPGITRSELLHGRPRWREPLETALGEGMVAEVEASVPGPTGMQRRVRRLYPPDRLPALPAVSLSGAELRRRREQRRLTAADVARHLPVGPSAVSSWERRDVVPSWYVEPVLNALEVATPSLGRGGRRGAAPISAAEARERVVAAVAASPGASRHRVLEKVGRSPVVLNELDRLIAHGEVVARVHPDSLGRQQRGLWLAAAAPADEPALAPFAPGELIAARQAAGLTQKALAQRVGITPGKISQWETGARVPSSARVVQLRAATASGPDRAVDPVDAETAAVLAMVGTGSGPTFTELRPWTREHRPAAIERVIAEGAAHWASVATTGTDGRRYQRRELHAGPSPATVAAADIPAGRLMALMAAGSLDQSELGLRVGVGQTSVWRWTRQGVPPARADEVLEVLLAAVESAPQSAKAIGGAIGGAKLH